jgi:phosphotransferase system enzyme I (PtsP)
LIARCHAHNTPVSFCGEDAGRPVEAVAFAAMGLRNLSMRPASIGPVKHMLRRLNLDDVRTVIHEARERGDQSVRGAINDFLRQQI